MGPGAKERARQHQREVKAVLGSESVAESGGGDAIVSAATEAVYAVLAVAVA